MDKGIKLIDELIIYDFNKYLYDLGIKSAIQNNIKIEENEIIYLCKLSSILSLSDSEDEQTRAYEIITKLFLNFYTDYSNLYTITHSILSRLGNFPNRELLNKYKIDEEHVKQSFLLELETMSRELENRVSLDENIELYLTDFQKKFYDVLTNKKFYSVSAPTSAGKSYIFTLSIIKRLLNNSKEIIVLIVPTRALIRELSLKIIKELKKYNLINSIDVRTVPIIEDELFEKGRVYILTQERLTALLEQGTININTCFIDEAQEIQSNRGVVLQNTLESLINSFPNVNLFFASPLIENPEYFNKLLDKDYDKQYFIEKISPVGQNIILLTSVDKKPKQVNIDLINLASENKNIGIFNLDFKFRNSSRIIDLAKMITKDEELTLVYCNGQSEAETRALSLSKLLDDINIDEINHLIEFIKEDIHKDYSIIECLKKGVAYHYGKMPSTVRSEIEQLASDGILKFIFCTSTLLQGVNLPAKNIIVHKPKKGTDTPMNRADFLNLIGRAGRLLHQFQGNIWCIEPDEWDEKCFEGKKLQKIESYFDKSLLHKTDKLIEIAKNEINRQNKDEVSVFGKFYSDYVINDQNIEKFTNNKSYENLVTLLEISKDIDNKLPNELVKKHYSIHPERLNNMYNFLKGQTNLEDFNPKKNYQIDYDVLKRIFVSVGNIFLMKSEQQSALLTLYANKWISSESMSQIIMGYHEFYKPNNINISIREVLKIIESDISFTYVVNIHAYLDILKIVLLENNKDYDIEKIANLPLYLECGTSDPIILNLISLGLSRLTSIRLKNSKQFNCEDSTVTSCFNNLQNLNIELLDIPEVCKNEIRSFII